LEAKYTVVFKELIERDDVFLCLQGRDAFSTLRRLFLTGTPLIKSLSRPEATVEYAVAPGP
jgi:hypothetical protein